MSILDSFLNLFKDNSWNHGDFLKDSPTDYRDVLASDVLGTLQPIPDVLSCPYPLAIKEQGANPFCVGESGSTMNEYEKRKQGISPIEFDGEWLYKECKKIDGIPDVKGTYFRAVLSVLKNKGAKLVGGNETDVGNYRIGGYAQVGCDFNSIKQAVYNFGTVLMGFKIYSNGSWQNAYIHIPQGSTVVAGHATVAKGYTPQYIVGQNSFGAGWGDHGNFYVPPTYLPYECWAIVKDIPVHLLPDTSKKPIHTFNTDLYRGMNNGEVKALQDCLVYFGCMTQAQVNTGYGIFGDKTLNGVVLFQTRYGIRPTGYFGVLSRSKMNLLLKVE